MGPLKNISTFLHLTRNVYSSRFTSNNDVFVLITYVISLFFLHTSYYSCKTSFAKYGFIVSYVIITSLHNSRERIDWKICNGKGTCTLLQYVQMSVVCTSRFTFSLWGSFRLALLIVYLWKHDCLCVLFVPIFFKLLCVSKRYYSSYPTYFLGSTFFY